MTIVPGGAGAIGGKRVPAQVMVDEERQPERVEGEDWTAFEPEIDREEPDVRGPLAWLSEEGEEGEEEPRPRGEGACPTCLLVKRRCQLADAVRGTCRDCPDPA